MNQENVEISQETRNSPKQHKNYNLLNEFIIPHKIQIRKSETHGYGVFATQDIMSGDVIEESAFAQLSQRVNEKVVDPVIRQLCYTVPCNCDVCKHAGKHFAYCTGYISMYNNGNENNHNVKFQWVMDSRVIRVIATKDIKKDQEIFVYYGPNYSDNLMNRDV